MTLEQLNALMLWVEAKASLIKEPGGAEENEEERTREDLYEAFGFYTDARGIVRKIEPLTGDNP